MRTTTPSTVLNTGGGTLESLRRLLLALQLFNAVSAVGGGIALAAGVLGVPVVLLRNTPFNSFLLPGIFLAVVIGGSATIAATAMINHRPRALITSAAAGVVMVGWILGETLLVEGFSWLQALYLLTGALALAASIRLNRAREARAARHSRWPSGNTYTGNPRITKDLDQSGGVRQA